MTSTLEQMNGLQLRQATHCDQTNLDELRRLSLEALLAPALSSSQRQTMWEYTPTDQRLIDDGTYFVIEFGGAIVASGGWSRRAALIRKIDEANENDRFLDPNCDAAAIRAMYTHPDYSRLGLGSILLSVCETAIRFAGFNNAELIATPSGRPFYLARRWREVRTVPVGAGPDSCIEASLMEKSFDLSLKAEKELQN